MNLVNIKNLNFKYNNYEILKNINLSIDENDIILLVGANGAGKTSLLRIIAGLHIVNNYDIFNVLGSDKPNDQCNGICFLGDRWERNISFCGVVPYSADIKAGCMMKNWQQKNIKRRNELVKVLHINLEWKMHQVSSGQRKRVQIMLGLLKPFKLLIIDEFFNELDVVVKDNLYEYLKKECKLRNASIIYATHIFDNLHEFANNIICISNGKLHNKINLNKFCAGKTLFKSIKEYISKDYFSNKDIIQSDNLKYGPQFGYGDGRSGLITNHLKS